jgi:tetratricopeptide (TPR) repeat protein
MVVLGTLLLLMVSPGVQAQEATLGQALQHYYRGDYPAAVDVLKSITDRDPENAAAYYYLGYTYQEMGNYVAARMAFQKTYEINPDFLPSVPNPAR